MSTKKIKVIVCRVGQHPVVEEIESGLASMQAIVGGSIECVGLGDGIDLWINEEGRINGIPLNRMVRDNQRNDWDIFGDFFIARVDYNEGESISLTPEDIEEWLPRVKDAPVSILDIPE